MHRFRSLRIPGLLAILAAGIVRLGWSSRPHLLHKLQAADHGEIDQGIAGDVVAAAKLDLRVGDTGSRSGQRVQWET